MRAVPGEAGFTKSSRNYAPAFLAQDQARRQGCQQTAPCGHYPSTHRNNPADVTRDGLLALGPELGTT